jgi:AraC-like DNA-binding protein
VRELSLHYGEQHNRLRFAAVQLGLAVPSAQRSGYLLARAACERALEAQLSESWATRVRTALRRAEHDAQILETIVRALGTSTSTLKRKLKSEGTAFSTLLEAEQRERACALLQAERLSIEQIAERVGYTNVSNFGRAFRRWTAMSPAAYRRAHRSFPLGS